MRSTNPREVGLIFRDYARKIHAKAVPTDPSFIRISVACGKVKRISHHQFFDSNFNNKIINRLNNGANTITHLSSKSMSKVLEAEHKLSTLLILAQVSSYVSNLVNGRPSLRGKG